jgi:hypothetical protein
MSVLSNNPWVVTAVAAAAVIVAIEAAFGWKPEVGGSVELAAHATQIGPSGTQSARPTLPSQTNAQKSETKNMHRTTF